MNKANKISLYISIIGFLGIFSTTISKNPVLPLFIKGLGGQDYILGIIAAASPFAGIILSFPVGYLADKLGKRKLLIISSFVFAISPLLYLFVSAPLLLIPIRFFHGMATAIMGPVASAIIVGSYEKTKAEKLGIYSSATLFGRTLAPLVGGFVISNFSNFGSLINYRLVYVVAFLAAVPVLVLSFLTPKVDGSVAVKAVNLKDMLFTLKKFFANSNLISTAGVDMATYYIYGVLEAYLPVYLVERNIRAESIGILFSLQVVSIALTKPFFGKLADKYDKRLQITLGILILFISTLAMSYAPSYFVYVIIVLIFGLGMSLSTVATSTYTAELVAKDSQASALGLLSSLMDVGQTSGPFLTGFIVTAFSYKVGFNIAALVAILSAVYFLHSNFSRKNRVFA